MDLEYCHTKHAWNRLNEILKLFLWFVWAGENNAVKPHTGLTSAPLH